MNIDLGSIISVTDANQNFSKLSKLVDKKGHALIFKNNKPKYIMIDMNNPKVFEEAFEQLKQWEKEQKGAKK